jgi:hypothetical protein
MTFISPVSTITSRFVAQWAASAYATVDTQLDNEAFDPPIPDVNNILATSWVRQLIQPASTLGIAFSGSEQDWTTGFATYQIFTPLGAGLGHAAEMANTIRGFFNRQIVSGVSFVDVDGAGPSWDHIGPEEETGFHQTNVMVPWQYFD